MTAFLQMDSGNNQRLAFFAVLGLLASSAGAAATLPFTEGGETTLLPTEETAQISSIAHEPTAPSTTAAVSTRVLTPTAKHRLTTNHFLTTAQSRVSSGHPSQEQDRTVTTQTRELVQTTSQRTERHEQTAPSTVPSSATRALSSTLQRTANPSLTSTQKKTSPGLPSHEQERTVSVSLPVKETKPTTLRSTEPHERTEPAVVSAATTWLVTLTPEHRSTANLPLTITQRLLSGEPSGGQDPSGSSTTLPNVALTVSRPDSVSEGSLSVAVYVLIGFSIILLVPGAIGIYYCLQQKMKVRTQVQPRPFSTALSESSLGDIPAASLQAQLFMSPTNTTLYPEPPPYENVVRQTQNNGGEVTHSNPNNLVEALHQDQEDNGTTVAVYHPNNLTY